MKNRTVKAVLHKFRSLLKPPNRFLKDCAGVIHVGANVGQERDEYERYGLRVVWIEPIPEVFLTLSANIRPYSRQRALEALVTDCNDGEYQFNVASNNGASSSILDFELHKDIWPNIKFEKQITLRSTQLPTLLEREGIDLRDYDALVMDTQGSEMLVLKGALPILRRFKYIKTEVPDFESYAGCCQLSELSPFMAQHGFREYSRRQFAKRAGGGSYFDIVYKRETPVDGTR
jgi:FkbM family methyltransferase